jgi:ABC-type transport system involved in cytochrome c biogenesis permease subunit
MTVRTWLPIVAFTVLAPCAVAQFELGSPAVDGERWTEETLYLFGTLPVQDGGRVKPVQTYANFQLLKTSGRRTCRDLDGNRMTSVEWLLNVLFYPGEAKQYEMFLVEDDAALEALGLPHEKKRARYSYNHIVPARNELMTLAQSYAHLEANQRTAVQTQLVHLAGNVREFERLTALFAFADATVHVAGFNELFGGAEQVGFVDTLDVAPAFVQQAMSARNDAALSAEARQQMSDAFTAALNQLESIATSALTLALIPPPGTRADNEEWLAPGDVAGLAFQSAFPADAQIGLVRGYAELAANRAEPGAFEAQLREVHEDTVTIAEARGEYGKIPLEVGLYNWRIFSTSQMLYVLCFLLAAVTWARPQNTMLWRTAFYALFIPTALLISGITMRCIIRDRPPVSTLYESILFIVAVAVVVAIFIEYVNRQRIALALAAVMGALGLFLANKYEMIDGRDTMPSLVAVLDTNFWLSTHVTTVTIGYAAGLLASAVAHVYLLGKLIGWRKNDNQLYRSLARMTYGIICFGLLFSVVGTVLGGIWANYSWGRFWGWDPKENGALMIILWELAILHSRMGGIIKNFGVSMAAVFGGIIIAFSWFGTNLLGVGLHSYGFTSGIAKALLTFYIIESAVIALGALAWWLRERKLEPAAAVD